MSMYDIEAAAALAELAALRAKGRADFQVRVLRLVAEGLTDVAIAHRMGCTSNRVRRVRVQAGVPRVPVEWAGL